MTSLEVLRIVVAVITFLLWVGSVVAFLFYRVPIDQGVFILTTLVFSFLFGPGVFKTITSISKKPEKNGNGNGGNGAA